MLIQENKKFNVKGYKYIVLKTGRKAKDISIDPRSSANFVYEDCIEHHLFSDKESLDGWLLKYYNADEMCVYALQEKEVEIKKSVDLIDL